MESIIELVTLLEYAGYTFRSLKQSGCEVEVLLGKPTMKEMQMATEEQNFERLKRIEGFLAGLRTEGVGNVTANS